MYPNKRLRISEAMPAAPRRAPSQEASWRPDTQAGPPTQQSLHHHLARNQRYFYNTPIPPSFLPHEMFRQQAETTVMNRSAPLPYTSDNPRVRQTMELEESRESLTQADPTASVVDPRKLRQKSLVNAFMDQGPKSRDWMGTYFTQLVEEADETTARQVKRWEEGPAEKLNQERERVRQAQERERERQAQERERERQARDKSKKSGTSSLPRRWTNRIRYYREMRERELRRTPS